MTYSAAAFPLSSLNESPARPSGVSFADRPSAAPVGPSAWALLASQVSISAAPVLWPDYARFAVATLRPAPRPRSSRPAPAVGVSASDAQAYAQWLSGGLRLPTADELGELARLARDNPQWEVFPDSHSPEGLSEWVSDPAENGLCRIVHRAWLLHGDQAHCQGALSDCGYSFVTFRLVRDSR